MGIHHFETSTTASWKRSLDRKRLLGYHSNSYSWKGKERTPPFGQTARVCTGKQTNLSFSEGILPRQLEFSFFDGEVNVNFEWSTFCAPVRRTTFVIHGKVLLWHEMAGFGGTCRSRKDVDGRVFGDHRPVSPGTGGSLFPSVRATRSDTAAVRLVNVKLGLDSEKRKPTSYPRSLNRETTFGGRNGLHSFYCMSYLIVTIICGYYILRIFAIWKNRKNKYPQKFLPTRLALWCMYNHKLRDVCHFGTCIIINLSVDRFYLSLLLSRAITSLQKWRLMISSVGVSRANVNFVLTRQRVHAAPFGMFHVNLHEDYIGASSV